MSHYIQTIYEEARTRFEQAFEYMRNSLEEYKTKQGGPDMKPDATRIYESRRRQLTTLANYYDAAEERLLEKEQEINDLKNHIRSLEHQLHSMRERHGETSNVQEVHIPYRRWLQLMLLVGNTDPVPIAALLSPKEGRRQASTQYAALAQPQLYHPLLQPPLIEAPE